MTINFHTWHKRLFLGSKCRGETVPLGPNQAFISGCSTSSLSVKLQYSGIVKSSFNSGI